VGKPGVGKKAANKDDDSDEDENGGNFFNPA